MNLLIFMDPFSSEQEKKQTKLASLMLCTAKGWKLIYYALSKSLVERCHQG